MTLYGNSSDHTVMLIEVRVRQRFIEEAESLMAGPAPPAPAAHTPGVIGAQEVYRYCAHSDITHVVF